MELVWHDDDDAGDGGGDEYEDEYDDDDDGGCDQASSDHFLALSKVITMNITIADNDNAKITSML